MNSFAIAHDLHKRLFYEQNRDVRDKIIFKMILDMDSKKIDNYIKLHDKLKGY